MQTAEEFFATNPSGEELSAWIDEKQEQYASEFIDSFNQHFEKTYARGDISEFALFKSMVVETLAALAAGNRLIDDVYSVGVQNPDAPDDRDTVTDDRDNEPSRPF
ncbi:hypothetical protein GWM83_01045 [Candidatus Bathyarchaeota archaeon]|nr:hypothetical protein [Candidatus Bathyarchaeota archaeon]NIR12558.1 hypothetical protein [Desulfobacterales bacterium]NIV67508.1 hypothetical protein [Candidatus Bathyarchaeota archaeon]NIW34139.1 hypothetical protein [Candidatus Bathyarchaeota archaeon]